MGKCAKARQLRKENQPTREQTRAIARLVRQQVNSELASATDRFYTQYTSVILWILYAYHNFTEEDLQNFLNEYNPVCDELKNYYIMDEGDLSFVCEEKLKTAGIDIEKLQVNAKQYMLSKENNNAESNS